VPPSSFEFFLCSMTWCTSLETDIVETCDDEAILTVVPEEQGWPDGWRACEGHEGDAVCLCSAVGPLATFHNSHGRIRFITGPLWAETEEIPG
jgi:hypothetical protein